MTMYPKRYVAGALSLNSTYETLGGMLRFGGDTNQKVSLPRIITEPEGPCSKEALTAFQ
jgi:hypothetical protein